MIDLVGEQDMMPRPAAHILIKVINRNNRVIRDRYDGVPFTFKPNEPITISQEQANHFFGWPGTDDERAIHMAKRFGWNTAEYVQLEPMAGPDALPLYKVYANNVVLDVQEFELVPKSKDKLADDGLDVDTMPTMEGFDEPPPHTAIPDRGTGAKVGIRKGSPVRLGGTGEQRRPGRPRKHPAPADDSGSPPAG